MARHERYPRGGGFPHELFVHEAIEKFFAKDGFSRKSERDTDSVFERAGECWQIEEKGVTESTGSDFRTGLGQLLQRMQSHERRYAIAVPDDPRFRKQLALICPWVRCNLGLHFLLVAEDQTVRIVCPGDPV